MLEQTLLCKHLVVAVELDITMLIWALVEVDQAVLAAVVVLLVATEPLGLELQTKGLMGV
jgi:hypothetical protein